MKLQIFILSLVSCGDRFSVSRGQIDQWGPHRGGPPERDRQKERDKRRERKRERKRERDLCDRDKRDKSIYIHICVCVCVGGVERRGV